MNKDKWLEICQLNMIWYYIQIFEDADKAKEYAKTHMPKFDDGRIEFLEDNFNYIPSDDIIRIIVNEAWMKWATTSNSVGTEEMVEIIKEKLNKRNEWKAMK